MRTEPDRHASARSTVPPFVQAYGGPQQLFALTRVVEERAAETSSETRVCDLVGDFVEMEVHVVKAGRAAADQFSNTASCADPHVVGFQVILERLDALHEPRPEVEVV